MVGSQKVAGGILERNGDQCVRELFHYMRARWVNKDNTRKKQRDIPQEADG